jgi:hypothetical protein
MRDMSLGGRRWRICEVCEPQYCVLGEDAILICLQSGLDDKAIEERVTWLVKDGQ